MSALTEDRRRDRAVRVRRGVPPRPAAEPGLLGLLPAGGRRRVVLSGQISIAAAAYSGALISGVIAFGLLAAAYLWFIHYEDRL